MYNQVRVRSPDQSFQRFLWRRPGSTEAPKTYQMMVQVFGLISSPTSCLYALQHAANNHKKFRYVGGIIAKSFYVDNYIDSFETEELAIETVSQVIKVLADGGFRLNQWVSSSRAVLSSIPASERVHQTLNLDLDDLPVERSLGVLWDCQHDCFKITTRQPGIVRTKREMLAEIARIFDPLGFLLPTTTYAKVLFQQVWKMTRQNLNDPSKREPLQWDEMLPDHVVKKWDLWRMELMHLEDVRVPRCFRDKPFPSSTTRFELHVFCDASEVAFGACCYLRMECEENVDTKFVFAKSRVAPIKSLSIPRLELQAAVLATRIAVSVKKELRLPIHSTLFWTDSEVVLKWLKSEHRRYSQFVHHRINEITETSSNEEWRFISGRENPADDCSRGLRPTKLDNQHRWFTGPPFIQRPVSQWAQQDHRQEPTAEELEVMKERVVLSTSIQTDPIANLFNDRSSLEELISAVIDIKKGTEDKDQEKQERATTVAEREEARRTLIHKMQEACFEKDVKTLIAGKQLKKTSRLLKLTPVY
ncbi:uncharacterized protein LOC123474542 [Daphnia magna]|uniref:uncharacterized protein LOC123474542 n=1 Tax=Daphnia magna TaxID=35525 RepID=UPI001E1BB14B|nr:uncharacterized protein LOC123474542 [Daphnia magna]